jgi:hypothetical protein
MRSETNVPTLERYLWFEGKASPRATEKVKGGLPADLPPHTELLFVGFAYADLPLGRRFSVVFPRDRPQYGVRCECRIIAATQQWGKPLSEVPDGWKTICMVQFPDGIPELVRQLPVVDDWYQNKNWVCVCDETTWECLKRPT